MLDRKRWPEIRFKEKRVITCEEHQAIIARQLNLERKAFYQPSDAPSIFVSRIRLVQRRRT